MICGIQEVYVRVVEWVESVIMEAEKLSSDPVELME